MSEINKCPALSANALLCNCSLEAGHTRSHVCRGNRQHTKHVFFKTRALEVPKGFGDDDISRELERQARLVAVEPQYLAELERHQAEDAKAIRALRKGWENAVNTARLALSGVGGWDEHIANARELDKADVEHAAAIQRAREK